MKEVLTQCVQNLSWYGINPFTVMHATWGLGIKCINVDLKKNKKNAAQTCEKICIKMHSIDFFFFFFIGLGNTWFVGI